MSGFQDFEVTGPDESSFNGAWSFLGMIEEFEWKGKGLGLEGPKTQMQRKK